MPNKKGPRTVWIADCGCGCCCPRALLAQLKRVISSNCYKALLIGCLIKLGPKEGCAASRDPSFGIHLNEKRGFLWNPLKREREWVRDTAAGLTISFFSGWNFFEKYFSHAPHCVCVILGNRKMEKQSGNGRSLAFVFPGRAFYFKHLVNSVSSCFLINFQCICGT